MLATVLFLLGILILVPSMIITADVVWSIIQWASGRGDLYVNSACPLSELSGRPCSYRGQAEAGWWIFLLDVAGGMLLFLGMRRIADEKPLILTISRWILIGALGLTGLALAIIAVAVSLPVSICGGPPYPCTVQDRQNHEVRTLISPIAYYLIWSAPTLSILAFIAWANIRRWPVVRH